MSNKTKFGISISELSKGWWSFGIDISHEESEIYVSINLFKWSIDIGKFFKWR